MDFFSQIGVDCFIFSVNYPTGDCVDCVWIVALRSGCKDFPSGVGLVKGYLFCSDCLECALIVAVNVGRYGMVGWQWP